MSFPPSVTNKTHRAVIGFTLIELLAMLAVMAILAAILIPVLQGVLHNSRSSESISNLRQIGAAVLLYTNEHGGEFPLLNRDPENPDSNSNFFWPQALERDVLDWERSSGAGKHPIFEDPVPDRHHGISDYGANPFLFYDANPDNPARRVSGSLLLNLADPINIIMVATSMSEATGKPSWHVQQAWAGGGRAPNRADGRLFDGQVGAVFADGHVDMLDYQPMADDLVYRRQLFDPFAEGN